MAQWFRSYAEALNDRKVQGLSDYAFRTWHNLLYLACQMDSDDGSVGTFHDVSWALRVEQSDAFHAAISELSEAGLITSNETDDETLRIISWGKRQYKSDTSTGRVRKHRDRVKRSETVTETAPEQSRAETEQSRGAAREKWMGRSAELEREGSEATGMDAERFLHQNGVVTMLDLEDEGFDILKHQLPLYRRIRDRKRKAGEPPPSRMTYFVKALRSEYADKPPPPVHEPEMVWVLATDARWEWLAARYRREKNRDVVAYSSAREEGVGAHFDKAWLAEAA